MTNRERFIARYHELLTNYANMPADPDEAARVSAELRAYAESKLDSTLLDDGDYMPCLMGCVCNDLQIRQSIAAIRRYVNDGRI